MSEDSLENDERVVAYIDVARRYCTLIESRADFSKPDFIKECAAILARLFSDAVGLLDVTAESPGEYDMESMSHEEWRRLYESLQQKLGKDDHYWLVFDPYEKEGPITSSLSDDLSDTYRNVKAGLDVFGRTQEDSHKAVCVWRSQFSYHWGYHCAQALRAIHFILQRIDDEEDE